MGNHINHRREVSPTRSARRLQGLLSELSTKIEDTEHQIKKGHGLSDPHAAALLTHVKHTRNEITQVRSELALVSPHITEHHRVEESVHNSSQRIGIIHQVVEVAIAAERLAGRLAAFRSDSSTEFYIKQLSEAVSVMIELLADNASPFALKKAVRETQIILGAASDKYAHLG